MTVGDLNKKFGIAPLFGMFMTFQFQNVEGYAQSFARTGNRLIHAHTGLLSFLNIMYGYGIDEVTLADNTKKLGGGLAVIGTLLVSISFFATIVPALGSVGFSSRILGFISLFVAILVLAVGFLKK
jgi:hypothetical protein